MLAQPIEFSGADSPKVACIGKKQLIKLQRCKLTDVNTGQLFSSLHLCAFLPCSTIAQ